MLKEQEAVWLQAGDHYADSRGFAGTTAFEGHAVRFHHDVGEPGEDVGCLRRDGEDLIESGANPDGSTFLEIWQPLADASGQTGSWTAAGCQVVRVGPHVVYVDAGTSAYLRM